MTKILQVIGGLNRGGAETMLMNIYRNINLEDFSFDFLVYYGNMTEEDYEQEIISIGGKVIKLDWNRNNFFSSMHKMFDIMVKGRYDAVHIHTLFNAGIVSVLAKNSKIPIIITHSHSNNQMKKENIIMKIYIYISRKFIRKCSNQYIACSQSAGEYLFGKKAFKKNGIIISNAIDVHKFNLNHIDCNLKCFSDEKINIGCIGSFYEVKNHFFLIELAEEMIKDEFLDFKFLLVGKGPLENKIKRVIFEKGLDEYFSFLGVREDIPIIMKKLDILVMPSLYEGIPVTLIESQASGLFSAVSTNIDKKVDMELGLIKRIDLKNIDEWLETIRSSKENVSNLTNEVIQMKMKEKGYDLKENTKILEGIYSHD